MMNSSLRDLAAAKNYYGYKNISDSYEYEDKVSPSVLGRIIWTVITLNACCIGCVGNGCIIWLLGFQIKRNSFTTFVLNLAIADCGYLASIVIHFIDDYANFLGWVLIIICDSFTCVMYINTHFLLTAISMDRCVAVLFPIWHRCSRPKHLSSTVCVLLWISSFLLGGIMNTINVFGNNSFHYLVTAIVSLPLITFSTLVLFIKVCLRSNQRNQGRLLLTILITFLCFLILAFPLNVLAVIRRLYNSAEEDNQVIYWQMCSLLFSCLSSSINPVIYFLVGRKKGAQSKQSMKVILQNAFKEGEATGGR